MDDEEKEVANEEIENELSDNDEDDELESETKNIGDDTKDLKVLHGEIEEYTYDKKKHLWCQITFLVIELRDIFFLSKK